VPRSAQFSFRRYGCSRCITESWWRKIKISEVFHASSHRASRSHVITLVIRRKTNRRHMTSDHHGRATDIATSLLTATDAILGTHRFRLAAGTTNRPIAAGVRSTTRTCVPVSAA
jgi:hypothetical protein